MSFLRNITAQLFMILAMSSCSNQGARQENPSSLSEENHVAMPLAEATPLAETTSSKIIWSSFEKAKKVARDEIYNNHHTTFYCGCGFVSEGSSGGRIDASQCGYTPRRSAARGSRLEWEHMVPAYDFGHDRPCWQNGHQNCVRRDGTPYKGRECCSKVDPDFKEAEVDLHNLVPSVGELNGDRSNRPYGIIEGEERIYGACDFEVDFGRDLAEPKEDIRGDIGRASLYMQQEYSLTFSATQLTLFETWNRQDPVDDWERTRNKRIYDLQGNFNPFVGRE